MTIKELLEEYYFHDSSIDDLKMIDGDLHVLIDFCTWMQEYYVEGQYPENETMKLIFKKATYNIDASEYDYQKDKIFVTKVENYDCFEIRQATEITNKDKIIEGIKFITGPIKYGENLKRTPYAEIDIISEEVDIIFYKENEISQ